MSTADSDHAPPEALSAYLDGEAPEWAAHLNGCARCEASLARLRAVVTAVSRPVPPPPPEAVDRAVVRALGTAPATGATTHDAAATRSWRGRPVLVGLASGSIAAVLLAVVAAFAVVGRGGGDRGDDTALASRPEAVQDRATAGAGAGGAQPQAFSGGHLGEIGDAAALAARLRGRIPGTGDGPAAVAASPQAAEGAGLPPPTPARCEAEARAGDPGLGPLVYVADGLRQGRPVVVLGFGGTPVTLLVLALEGCGRELSTTVP